MSFGTGTWRAGRLRLPIALAILGVLGLSAPGSHASPRPPGPRAWSSPRLALPPASATATPTSNDDADEVPDDTGDPVEEGPGVELILRRDAPARRDSRLAAPDGLAASAADPAARHGFAPGRATPTFADLPTRLCRLTC